MARWNNLEDGELDARTVYTGSYGFCDNDALGKVWARTLVGFDKAMSRVINSEARTYQSDDETFRQVRDSIWYVGPFAETVSDLVADMEERTRADEMRDDIRTSSDGFVY